MIHAYKTSTIAFQFVDGGGRGDGKTIFVTPSVRYAGQDLFTEPTSFDDPVTDETLTAKVVIQLFIKPGSYKVGPQTVSAVSETDPNISDEELEWTIMEPDSTLLFGLLIKLDEEVIFRGETVSEKRLSCEYQEKCRRFKDLLKLPNEFFDSNNDSCFCIKCHTARGIKPNTNRGTPAMVYWLPIGWCRIGLKTGTPIETIHLRHIWHIAFHGTSVQNIKSILEAGALVIPGNRGKQTVGRLRCGYQEKCRRFKDSLRLSDDFFDSQNDRCFCTKCLMGIGRYQKRGNPVKDYRLPVGGSRIGFRMEPRASSLKVKTQWHVSFHGTRKECVQPILECGDLLMPGDVCLGGKQLRESGGHFNDNWKPTEFDTKQIFVSPSVRYAGHECYAKSTRYVDRVTGEEFNAKVVFQLYIKPDSYKVGPQTIGATDEIDPKISNQEIEWSTKQRGATVFYGLLVKLDETG